MLTEIDEGHSAGTKAAYILLYNNYFKYGKFHKYCYKFHKYCYVSQCADGIGMFLEGWACAKTMNG